MVIIRQNKQNATPHAGHPSGKKPQFSDCHNENVARFSQVLEKHNLWHILPQGKIQLEEATGLFHRQSQLIYHTAKELDAFLKQHPFIYIRPLNGNNNLATLHTSTKLLWNNETSHTAYCLSDGKNVVAQGRWAELNGWQLPSKDQLYAFASAGNNPYRRGQDYRLAMSNGNECYDWLAQEGMIYTYKEYWGIFNRVGTIFACHALFAQLSPSEILIELINRGWKLVEPNNSQFIPSKITDPRWQGLNPEALLLTLGREGVHFLAADGKTQLHPKNFDAIGGLTTADYTPCRLPKLDTTRMTDPEKGVWELFGEPPVFLHRVGMVARDPGQDVQHRAVAIDFGTSSTVVAMDTEHGERELLRIGVRDFYQAVKPEDFENPTVLEFLDLDAFLAVWNEQAYRPALDWNWTRAAHEAQTNFRDNPGDTQILASIVPKLKQWALRSAQTRLRLTDRKGQEMELPPHKEYNPVRGQPLTVNENYPLDPIELYAWYLGMAINWRERGIFLKYYFSFPVKYSRQVKDCILASFRRGLQRSLPETLIDHHPEVLNTFEVNELASEPAAYAAAALPHLKVMPTPNGVPYAVFDFGGGTTDFDFGFLRRATPEEEEEGYEKVFEHLASSGDNYLGGENLLEHLVYAVFQQNINTLRTHKIQFTKPLDAKPFTGSEAFLAPTQTAQTNTVMLAAKLRPFLEANEKIKKIDQIKLDLFDANGQKQECDLAVDTTALDELLQKRMHDGVIAFLSELAKLQPELPKESPIHILLAGNGSRSRHVQQLFDSKNSQWPELVKKIFGDKPPKMEIHPPLPMDEKNPHAPTTKTGVALGLLRLAPGENTLLVNHIARKHDGEAPFAWFVGRLRQGHFAPVLSPGAEYGAWEELGPLQQGVFNVYVTVSPRANNEMGLAAGDAELKKYRFDFPAAPMKGRVFARPTGPKKLELVAVANREALNEHLAPKELILGLGG